MTAVQKTLPKGWKMVKLGEVADEDSDIVAGPFGSNLKVSDYQGEGIPIMRLQNVERNKFIEKDIKYITPDKARELSYHSYRPGDLVLAKLGDPIGKTCLVPDTIEAGIVVSDVVRIRINLQKADKKYILHALNSSICSAQFKKDTIGTTRPRVNLTEVRNLKIPLPPFPTQHKIVEILEEADNLRKLRQQADEKMKDLIPSLFVQMFGDPATNPKGWKVIELRKTSTFKRGPFGGSLKKEIFVKNGYKVYEQKNAIYNDFEIGNYFVDEDKYHEMIAFAIQPDDLIISCSGTMGKVAIVPRSAKQGIINQALLKITPLKNMAIPLYLKFLFESRSLQNKYFSNAAGSAIQNVTSVDSLKRIKVPLPPLPLQQEFAKLVEEVESEKARQTESRKKLDELFNSLMQRAFTGELVA